MPKIIVIGHYC